MTATAPPPVVNRIAGYMSPAPQPVPETPEGKREAWGDALFAAAMFYQSRLAHPDPEVAERAARALFDLEKTRLRHGRELAGAEVETPKAAETHEERKEMPTRAEIQRLGKVVELAMNLDAVEDDDGPTEEERMDDEIVERFARTEAFQAHVEEARKFIRSQGLPDRVDQAVEFAKMRLREDLRRKRTGDVGTYPNPKD